MPRKPQQTVHTPSISLLGSTVTLSNVQSSNTRTQRKSAKSTYNDTEYDIEPVHNTTSKSKSKQSSSKKPMKQTKTAYEAVMEQWNSMTDTVDNDTTAQYRAELGFLNEPGSNIDANDNFAPLNTHQRLVQQVASRSANSDSDNDSDTSDTEQQLKQRKQRNNAYFESQKYSGRTSDNTLDMLNLITVQQRMQLTQTLPITNEQSKIDLLVYIQRECFPLWKWILACTPHNILLHGIGSKKKLLNYFAKLQLKDCHIIVINGFQPNLTLLSCVKNILSQLLRQDVTQITNMSQAYAVLKRVLTSDQQNTRNTTYNDIYDSDSEYDTVPIQNDTAMHIEEGKQQDDVVTPEKYRHNTAKRDLFRQWKQCNYTLTELQKICSEYNIQKTTTVFDCIEQLTKLEIRPSEAVAGTTRQSYVTTDTTTQQRAVKLPQLIVMLVNSLDGIALRNTESQEWLCELAKLPRIKLICSVDHINSQYLITTKRQHIYNFVTLPCNTYIDYTRELLYDPECTQVQSQVDQSKARGITHVLKSLTPRHVDILQQLAQLQCDAIQILGNDFSGILHSDWTAALQENMLWQNELTFKNICQEYITHGLLNVVEKRYTIPYSIEIIQQHIIEYKK